MSGFRSEGFHGACRTPVAGFALGLLLHTVLPALAPAPYGEGRMCAGRPAAWLRVIAREAVAQTSGAMPSESAAGAQEAVRERLPRASAAPSDFLGMMAGPVDEDMYVVGPGDRFHVGIWSRPPLEHDARVDLEGNVQITGSGVYRVAGMTLAEARETVIDGLRRYHPGADLTFSLVEARRFRVFLLGSVEEPGSFPASGADRVSDLLDRGGELPASASGRHIRLIRRSGDTLMVDFARFRRTGELELNPLLQDGDRVIVPIRGASVEIFGAIGISGFYEYVEGERFSDLLAMAGGLNHRALTDSVRMVEVTPSDEQNLSRFFPYPEDDPLLVANSQFFVRSDPLWERGPVVNMIGQFRYPTLHPIEERVTRVRDAVEAAGGFTDRAAIQETVLLRSGAVEELTDMEFERLKQVPVADMNEMEYDYFRTKLRERPGKIQVDFLAVMNDPDHPDNIPLLRGDIITAPSLREYVQVSGQVASPGAIMFEEGLTVADYLRRAGGLSWNARKSHMTWIRAETGEWVRRPDTRTVPGPGDVIWVPEKPDRDYWLIFRETIAVTAQMATVVLLAREVTR